VISLRMPVARSAKYDFRYLLFKSRQSTSSESQVPYERFVMYEKKSDLISYTARFPVTGHFKLDVFGLEVGQHESYDLICSYLIHCTDADKKATLLPDCPEIGWGPGSLTEQVKVLRFSHNSSEFRGFGLLQIFTKRRFFTVFAKILATVFSAHFSSRKSKPLGSPVSKVNNPLAGDRDYLCSKLLLDVLPLIPCVNGSSIKSLFSMRRFLRFLDPCLHATQLKNGQQNFDKIFLEEAGVA